MKFIECMNPELRVMNGLDYDNDGSIKDLVLFGGSGLDNSNKNAPRVAELSGRFLFAEPCQLHQCGNFSRR